MTTSSYREYVERVRAATDLVPLVEERLTLTANMAVCPFHPDTRPSLSVNPARQFFYCFGCKVSGDVFGWVERLEGVSFRAAVDALARRAGVAPFASPEQEVNRLVTERQMGEAVDWYAGYYAHHLTAEARDFLLGARGLPEGVLERFRLGWSDGGATAEFLAAAGPTWAPVLQAAGIAVERRGGAVLGDHLWDRVTFPGLVRGRATFLSGRTLAPDVEPKYLNQRGIEAPLYNEDDLGPDRVFAVEGQIDALSLWAFGVPTVGCLGGVKTRHLQKLRRAQRVYAVFDADRAGRESTVRLGEALGAAVRVVQLPEGMDPNDYLRAPTTTPAAFAALVDGAQDPIAWAVGQCPPRTDPAEEAAVLVPVFRLLAPRSPVEQELYWARWVAPRLGLGPAATRRARTVLEDYTVAARQQCSQCGASLTRGRG